MGTLDERTSIRWLGGFRGMLPWGNFWNLRLLNGWKCISNFQMSLRFDEYHNKGRHVKSRNLHDMPPPPPPPPKGRQLFKDGLPTSYQFPESPPPPPLTGNERLAPKLGAKMNTWWLHINHHTAFSHQNLWSPEGLFELRRRPFAKNQGVTIDWSNWIGHLTVGNAAQSRTPECKEQ